MMGQCVILVISSRYLVFAGSVQSVLTMTCALSATIVTNIICAIGFSGLTHLEVKGLCHVGCTYFDHLVLCLALCLYGYLAHTLPIVACTV